MEITKKNRVVEFLKTYWLYLGTALALIIMGVVFTVVGVNANTTPTGTSVLKFVLPMDNPSVIKDFSNTELQNNETLNQWEAHLSVDLTSESGDVFAILDGTVASIDYNFLEGYTVVINHTNGLSSIYSSLAEQLLVEVGDLVEAGAKIGVASDSASGELDLGAHLHFAMKVNDLFVDPNNYLDLQQK